MPPGRLRGFGISCSFLGLGSRSIATSAGTFTTPRACAGAVRLRASRRSLTSITSHRPLLSISPPSSLYSSSLHRLHRTMATTPPANGSTDDPSAPGAIDPQQENSSGVTADALRDKLQSTLEASHVDVQDISGGCGQSFAATIVSAKFEGKMALARHRLVNASVKDEVGKIHAWTPKCLTPAEWEKRQGQS